MNKHDIKRNLPVYEKDHERKAEKTGYDWWRHSFVGKSVSTGKKKSFFIEYFLLNPGYGKETPQFGENGSKPSYLMIHAGCWGEEGQQFQRYFGIDQVDSQEGFLKIVAGDCFLSETNMWGSVRVTPKDREKNPNLHSDIGVMCWSLHVNKRIAFHVGYGASRPVQRLNAVDMFWHAEGMKTEFEGTILLNGEEYEVQPKRCYGYADKNWGKEFASTWLRLSGNHLKSARYNRLLTDSAFDIATGSPKLYGIPLKDKMLMEFYREGKEFEFNFSKVWTKTKSRFICREKNGKMLWIIKSMNLRYAIEVHIECPRAEMNGTQFQDPDGSGRTQEMHNAGTGKGEIYLYQRVGRKLRLIDHIYAKNVYCEYGKYDAVVKTENKIEKEEQQKKEHETDGV